MRVIPIGISDTVTNHSHTGFPKNVARSKEYLSIKLIYPSDDRKSEIIVNIDFTVSGQHAGDKRMHVNIDVLIIRSKNFPISPSVCLSVGPSVISSSFSSNTPIGALVNTDMHIS